MPLSLQQNSVCHTLGKTVCTDRMSKITHAVDASENTVLVPLSCIALYPHNTPTPPHFPVGPAAYIT